MKLLFKIERKVLSFCYLWQNFSLSPNFKPFFIAQFSNSAFHEVIVTSNKNIYITSFYLINHPRPYNFLDFLKHRAFSIKIVPFLFSDDKNFKN